MLGVTYRGKLSGMTKHTKNYPPEKFGWVDYLPYPPTCTSIGILRNTLDFESRFFGPKIYLGVTSKTGCVIYVHKYPRSIFLCEFSLYLCIVSFFALYTYL